MREQFDVLVENLAQEFGHDIISSSVARNELKLEVRKDTFPVIAAHIKKNHHVQLISEHAVDLREKDGSFHIYLIFSLPKEDHFVTIRTRIDASDPTFRSITPEIYAANWFEREIMEGFGIVPVGHPDPRPIRLYDDWPSGTYPMRKDFDLSSHVPRTPSGYEYRKVEGEGVFEVPVGPVHAGVIEPGHFRFSVAGESILHLEIRMGYVHKGLEKLSESMRYDHGVFLAERISGDNGFTHSLAYCQAIESIAGIGVPDRARFLRTVYSEMERIYNLFGDIGGIAMDVAFSVGAQNLYLLKERALSLNEKATGSRLLRSVNRIGGVNKDIDADMKKKISTELVGIKLDFDDVVETLTGMASLLDRVETTGTLPTDAAKNFNVVGPIARASGIDRDVRRDHPYAAYDEVSFSVPSYREGDVYARMMVKIEEVLESISIIEQAMDRMPQGPLFTEAAEVPEGNVGMSLTETHRGEAMHWVLSGNGMPYRHKVRDASFLNWPAIEQAVLGNIIPDFPLVNKSFNLSYSGNDL
ncbi:MAG: NADH-quinone oxidoreductase subunit C [Methanomassiliicoccales archaeon]|nr:MAG: NADH-quinone oxidoreductase subunit C [Methanomassiliicoccales archaeon]